MVENRHDVSDALANRTEPRAHVKTLEALRETQLETGEKIDRMGETIDRMGETIDREFADVRSEMRKGFTKLNLGMAQITALLNVAIGRDSATD